MKSDAGVTHADEGRMEKVAQQAEAIAEVSSGIVDWSVQQAANDSGRTVQEQWDRMADGYAYQAAEQDPEQKQLDDYELTGDTVEVHC